MELFLKRSEGLKVKDFKKTSICDTLKYMETSPKIFSIIDKYAQKHELFMQDSSIIVGFSGGPDSLFLLHYLLARQKMYDLRLIAAHFDHEWRENSGDDVQFCQTYAQKRGIEFISKKASEMKKVPWNGSKEAQGRVLRRAFFEQIRHDFAADSVALAHHQDDQLETFFMRIIRGTSLQGLCAMQPKSGFYIRPLLTISKNDILTYLHEQGSVYLLDSSNDSDAFLRNRLRKTVLPALQASDKRFEHNCLRMLQHLTAAEDFLHSSVETFFQHIQREGGIHVPSLLSAHEYLQHRLLIHWLCAHQVPFLLTEKFLKELIRFLHNSKSNEHLLGAFWSVHKKRGYAYVTKKESNNF